MIRTIRRRLAAVLANALLATVPVVATAGDALYADGFDRTVLLEPYLGPAPAPLDAGTVARIPAIDLYVILDRSGSMSTEISAVKNNLASVLSQLTCPPLGSGDPLTCIADLWGGAGTVGYAGSGVDAYRHAVDVQQNPNFSALPVTEPGGCCAEPMTFAVYATVTGSGGTDFGLPGVPARSGCATSPAVAAGYTAFGYGCFRTGALPLVLLATDEPPLVGGDTYHVPDWTTVVLPAMLARGARLIGILGSGFVAGTDNDLKIMAGSSGAVDATNGNAPLVFDGAGVNAASAIRDGVLVANKGLPLRVSAAVEDDASDAVDAVAAFVDHVEVRELGTPECANGLTAVDGDSDGHLDAYTGVVPGTGLCWRLVPKANTTVPATGDWQIYRATLRMRADVDLTQATQALYFLVPPLP